MAKRTRSPKTPWSQTAEGLDSYRGARAGAQELADRDGFDIGIWPNEIFRCWTTQTLPRRENRFGHEARCEVVSCSVLARCQPGHGPTRAHELEPTPDGWQR